LGGVLGKREGGKRRRMGFQKKGASRLNNTKENREVRKKKIYEKGGGWGRRRKGRGGSLGKGRREREGAGAAASPPPPLPGSLVPEAAVTTSGGHR
jgi:hypothetical protein